MRNELTRREVMSYAAVGAAGLLLPAASEATAWNCIKYVARLQPTRFIAGLLYDVGKAVVVKTASEMIIKSLSSRHYSRSAFTGLSYNIGESSRSELLNESNFQPAPYKASVITLGIADYELHPQRKIKMQLNNEEEKRRFQKVLRYLQDEQIRIQFGKMEYAKSAKEFSDLEPDDLLTLMYWDLAGEQERHVQQLVAATGVSAFKHLVV